MESEQIDLFRTVAAGPEGLRYEREFLSREEEAELAERIAALPLKPFEFQGFLGKRRVHSFGWQYVFDGSGLRRTEEIPGWLLPVRDRAAAFGSTDRESLQHVLIIEYAPGAGIGWHRDRPEFGDVVGVSLLAPARLRFRRKVGEKWDRTSLVAEPRSAYLLRGPARSEWEHSIPPLEVLRYSITFRALKRPLE